MSKRVLTARDVLVHMALSDDLDAPVLIQAGLFGSEYATVRAVGSVGTPDFGMKFARRLPVLTVADEIEDDPMNDQGWKARGANLRRLLDEIKEPSGD